MKVLFLVQGEGRGHMTQAISLGQILREAGHEIVGALVGKANDRQIPTFFEEQIHCPVFQFLAPNISYSNHGKGMQVGKTLLSLITNSKKYLKALHSVHDQIQDHNPDLIISFYETYSGLYNVVFRSKIPMICIAHQYLLLHPKFVFPKNRIISKILMSLNSQATSWQATKRLALSFRRMEPTTTPTIAVVPPLLRKEVVQRTSTQGDFFLVYMTHHSLSNQIIEWHQAHPEVPLHCFWDNPYVSEEFQYDATLTFHRINSGKYLDKLSSCKALVTTAGFESVCEAMYLGKPVMMVPVPNHFEQECNAIDGVIAGAGITSKTFDLSLLLEYLPKHQDQSKKFKNWYHSGHRIFLKEVEEAVSVTTSSKTSVPMLLTQRIVNSFF